MTKRLLAVLALFCGYAAAQVTVAPILQPRQTFVDASGSPCVGCMLYSYTAGTTIPTPTYTDASGGVANTNPIILNMSGGANIWVDTSIAYKFTLKTSAGTTIWTVDYVESPSGDVILANPTVSQTILQPLDTNFNFITSGAGKVTYNGSEVLTQNTGVQQNPGATQTISQPGGTNMNVNTSAGGTFNYNGEEVATKSDTIFENSGTWLRNGSILIGDSTNQYATQEPTVIFENNVFKMWYTSGWSATGLSYATSVDGMNWLKYNNGVPLIAGVFHGFVFKNGATYYYYGVANGAMNAGWRRYSSADGLTWSLDASNILPGTGSGWDATQRGNIFVWIEGTTWYALYEALGSDTVWRIGLATSADGTNFTPYAGNPVIKYGTSGMMGGPEMHKIGDTYYVWAQGVSVGIEPTDIYRWKSTDLHTWTMDPANQSVLHRMTFDEGVTAAGGQVADVSIIERNGKTYMFYDATDTQGPTPYDGIHIKLAIAPFTLADLVQTQEGDAGATALNSQYNFPLWGYGGPAWSPDGLQIPVQPPGPGRFDLWRLTFQGATGSSIGYNSYLQSGTWYYTFPGYGGVHFYDSGDGSYHFQSTQTSGSALAPETLVDSFSFTRDGHITVPGGVAQSGGIKHLRASVGCSTSASVGATCTSPTQTWGTPFANNNYTLTCSLNGAGGVPTVVGTAYVGTGTGFTITIAALTTSAASGNYDCIAIHD